MQAPKSRRPSRRARSSVDQHSADRDSVPAEELGGRVVDEIRAMIEGLQQIRRREGRIHEQRQFRLVRDGGDRGNVEDLQSRVAECLAEEQPRVRANRLSPGIEVARANERGLDAEARQRIGKQIVRAAVERARGDEVRARAGDRRHREVQRGLAARGRDGPHAAFERRHALLEHRVGRIGDARIDVPAALHVEERRRVVRVAEDEGGGEVDRRRTRARDRIGPLARVQAERVELQSAGCGHDVLLGVRRILAGHMVCHSRASGNPATLSGSHWVPAWPFLETRLRSFGRASKLAFARFRGDDS